MEEQVFTKGQTVWRCTNKQEVIEDRITKVEWISTPWGGHFTYHCGSSRFYYDRDKGKSIFDTLEDAERMAEHKRKLETKRLLLLEYEEEVNKMLGLEDHFLIRKHKGE